MKLVILMAAASSLILMGACAPDLAETPLTPEETQWKGYLQDNYPGWRAPQTVYPTSASASSNVATPAATAVEEETAMVSSKSSDGSSSFQMVEEKTYDDGSFMVKDTRVTHSSPSSSASSVTYKVQKGDTLTGIAHKHYNKASQWKRIYNANSNVIGNPNKLKPGMVLQIPQ